MDRSKFTEAQLEQIDKSRTYWNTRLEDLTQRTEQLHEDKVLKLLQAEYRRSDKIIKGLVEDIYFDMLETGGISTTKLYQYGRFKALDTRLTKELKRLGVAEEALIKVELELAYAEQIGKAVGEFGLADFALPNKKAIERVVMSKWLGRDFSTSIWQNKTKMLNVLEREIRNCVSLGYSKDKAIVEVMRATGACFKDAERLVRTELMHILNNANDEVAKQAKYKYKMWLTAKDERVCDVCLALEDEPPVPIDAMLVSHPRCRCCFIYLKDYTL